MTSGNGITSPRAVAEMASFQAFVNCYLNEVDAGVWFDAPDWSAKQKRSIGFTGHKVVELTLSMPGQIPSQLAIEIIYQSMTGRHRFGEVVVRNQQQADWQQVEAFDAVLLLIKQLFRRQGTARRDQNKINEIELLNRLLQSYQLMTHYIAERYQDERLSGAHFIDSEQSLLFGHWLHPTPKSRQGMPFWSHEQFAPELAGRFQLDFFIVDKALLQQGSISAASAQDMIDTAFESVLSQLALTDQQALIPMHPLQAQYLLRQPYVAELIADKQLQYLGSLGPMFAATSSVRTLYSAQLGISLKFSLPVKITNSLRVNKRHELQAGLVAAELLGKFAFDGQEQDFFLLEDPAFITLTLPAMKETGFEIIIRDNPFIAEQSLGIHCIAALTQEPLPNQQSRLAQLIAKLAVAEQRPTKQVAYDWFSAYFQVAIANAILLYDQHGIALEAHQQNSLLDVSDGYPSRYYFRDNQGFYLAQSRREQHCALVPAVADCEDLFYDEALINDRFAYYLIVNQLSSVINRLGIDGFIAESEAILMVRAWLQTLALQCDGLAKTLINSLLYREQIPAKANLLTRVHDVDELTVELEQAVYVNTRNPLYVKARTRSDRKFVNGEVNLEVA